jgi:AraC-like DNA-binding protein
VVAKLESVACIVTAAGALQGFFMTGLLLARRKKTAGRETVAANAVLAALMSLFSLNIIHSLVTGGSGAAFSPRGRVLYEPLQFLFGPLVFLYVRALSGKWSKPVWRDIFHLVPFFALTTPFVFIPVSGAAYPLAGFLNVTLRAAAFLQLSAYLVATARDASLHDRAMRDLSSTKDGDVAWVKSFLAAFACLSVIDLVALVWTIHIPGLASAVNFQSLASCVAVYALGFRVLLRPPDAIPLSEARAGEALPDASRPESGKYTRSGLDRGESDRIADEARAFMEARKPYLDPDLGLSDLARMCGIARNQLSQALNGSLGKNFYDFVNEYRILEFKRLAADPARRGDKILSLALDSGFNSKPAFNLIFKKTCGLTPSAFRSSMRT